MLGLDLGSAASRLSAVSDTPRLDAELLLAHALGIGREQLLLAPPIDIPPAFEPLLLRRLAHEPIAYILGVRDFWTISLGVRPGVLIPRPDSETLIEAAVAHFTGRSPATILDLGTGSGALLLAALDQWRGARGVGIDRSSAAVEIARANAATLGLFDRARFLRGDWAAAIGGAFDLVLCNPPYVEDAAPLPPEVADHEPAAALFAGPDGLDAYRLLAPQLARLIAPGGMAAVEIGASQRDAVTALMTAHPLAVSGRRDLGGRDRCLVLTRA